VPPSPTSWRGSGSCPGRCFSRSCRRSWAEHPEDVRSATVRLCSTTMLKDLEHDCREPGAWHRGMPFWAWNGRLSPDELRRQIRLMKQMGLGGFFMHSRVGLATPYLQDEWFECIAACAEEAGQQGRLAG